MFKGQNGSEYMILQFLFYRNYKTYQLCSNSNVYSQNQLKLLGEMPSSLTLNMVKHILQNF